MPRGSPAVGSALASASSSGTMPSAGATSAASAPGFPFLPRALAGASGGSGAGSGSSSGANAAHGGHARRPSSPQRASGSGSHGGAGLARSPSPPAPRSPPPAIPLSLLQSTSPEVMPSLNMLGKLTTTLSRMRSDARQRAQRLDADMHDDLAGRPPQSGSRQTRGRSGSAASPGPRSTSISAAAGGSGHKFRIKRDPSLSASLLPDGDGRASSSAPAAEHDFGASPARPPPARTYSGVARRKRKRESGTGAGSSSEDEPLRAHQPAEARANGSAAAEGKGDGKLGIRLKTNIVLPRKPRRTSDHPLSSLALSGPGAPDGPPPAGWELPPRHFTVPELRPARPPPAHATHPLQVTQDFSSQDWKERERERDRLDALAGASSGSQPTALGRARDKKGEQTPHHVFQHYTDTWFRTLTEDDLAWLSAKRDDTDSFQIPPLGRHYSEQWAAEDADFFGISSAEAAHAAGLNGTVGGTPAQRLALPPAAPFDPRTMRDEHASGASREDARGGPLTERLLSALLPVPPGSSSASLPLPNGSAFASGSRSGFAPSSQNGASPQTNGRSPYQPGTPNGHSDRREPIVPPRVQDMRTFEERLRGELRILDVVGDEPTDWSARQDDEISAMLRTVQLELRTQIDVNAARKERLYAIATDRMAYQDYMSCMTSVEKEIEIGWNKRQAAIKRSLAPKKKKGGSAAAAAAAAAASANGHAGGASQGAAGTSGGDGAAAAGTPGGPGGASIPGASSSLPGPAPPQFSDSLIAALKSREQLQRAFMPMFTAQPHAWRTPRPDESVFADLPSEQDPHRPVPHPSSQPPPE